jgi:hypothetical protein
MTPLETKRYPNRCQRLHSRSLKMAQLMSSSQLRMPLTVRRILRILTEPYFLSLAIPVCVTGTVYGVWKLYWRRKGR